MFLMDSSDEKAQAQILEELAEHKKRSEDLAELFKMHRQDLRAALICAVTECGLSVKKAAETAGMDRRTVTVWLQVHNAEQKGRRK